eukprot:TRINITY_DN3149_c4_g2_i1.p1 TRINITY_DN3149_c4_g2~~TRINITY_DN3149_c4_g2_i1.p1  ORF type:complete len:251 (+),score=102.51 TRINITY_DN3149_c4_g2_i1:141-893(+)
MPHSPLQKLQNVTQRFGSFQTEVEVQMEQRRSEDDRKYSILIESVGRIEKNLESEIRHRQEGDKALQSFVEKQMKNIVLKVEATLAEKLGNITANVDSLIQSVNSFDNNLENEMTERINVQSDLKNDFNARLGMIQENLDTERTALAQQEANVNRRVGDEIKRIQERLDTERLQRESEVRILKNNVQEDLKVCSKTEESLRLQLSEEFVEIKSTLLNEEHERKASDEEVVHSIEGLMDRVQKLMEIMSRR